MYCIYIYSTVIESVDVSNVFGYGAPKIFPEFLRPSQHTHWHVMPTAGVAFSRLGGILIGSDAECPASES
jgi:hypothetical protein